MRPTDADPRTDPHANPLRPLAAGGRPDEQTTIVFAADTDPTAPASPARIDDVVDRLQAIQLTLERLHVSVETLTRRVADHETRVRRLERWQQRMQPLLGAITFVLGAIATLAMNRWGG